MTIIYAVKDGNGKMAKYVNADVLIGYLNFLIGDYEMQAKSLNKIKAMKYKANIDCLNKVIKIIERNSTGIQVD